MISFLKGPLGLVFRYFLLLAGSSLATAGVITQTGAQHFCFDSRLVADAAASGVVAMFGGGASIAAGIGWRWWAKRRNGVT